jgi:hypothetical protein
MPDSVFCGDSVSGVGAFAPVNGVVFIGSDVDQAGTIDWTMELDLNHLL